MAFGWLMWLVVVVVVGQRLMFCHHPVAKRTRGERECWLGFVGWQMDVFFVKFIKQMNEHEPSLICCKMKIS